MRAHRNDVYRARRSRGKVWPVLLWILAGLIVLAVILFYAGQKYIVYGSDGSLHVIFPIMETPAPVTEDGQPETVDTELVLEDPDYSGIISDAGKDLSELHAQYLTADKITPEGLTRAAASVKAAGGNALVLQMKAPGGTLSWKSGVSEASAYGVNGTAELADAIRTVKGQDIYLVAVVSACVDSLMAERYAATAQQTASGSAYTDSSGGWVDPYNTFTRTYLVSLCKELRELGFDCTEKYSRNLIEISCGGRMNRFYLFGGKAYFLFGDNTYVSNGHLFYNYPLWSIDLETGAKGRAVDLDDFYMDEVAFDGATGYALEGGKDLPMSIVRFSLLQPELRETVLVLPDDASDGHRMTLFANGSDLYYFSPEAHRIWKIGKDGAMTLTALAPWGERLYDYATVTSQGTLFHDITTLRLSDSETLTVQLKNGTYVNCSDFLKLQ